MKIAIVVVTYNRMALLTECTQALLNQSYRDFDLLVIDNASTDNTAEFLAELMAADSRVKYYNTGANLGGAGGFAYGVKEALSQDYDYLWLMDDDSIPNQDALEKLVGATERLAAANKPFSFMSNAVLWTDDTLSNMNLPEFSDGYNKPKAIELFEKNDTENYEAIRSGSFVGCFINCKCAKKTHLPVAEMFIYGDDMEYTRRLSLIEKGYYITDSVIIHKMMTNESPDVATAPMEKLQRYYYQARNSIYIARISGSVPKSIKRILHFTGHIILRAKDHKLKRCGVWLKGAMAGMSFNPKTETVK